MVLVAFVLFVLVRYRSPQLAGAAEFLAVFPGLVASPIAGALLDRRRKSTLIAFDYGVAGATGVLVGALAALNWLPAPLFLVIVGLSSLTSPLSFAGGRALFPLIAPRYLWERANALDSSGYVIASICGAPIAGVLVGAIGGGSTLAVTGVLFALAAALLYRLPEPVASSPRSGSVLRSSWQGVHYVATNPSLRGIALTFFALNLGSGILVIAVPVLVLNRLHGGPSVVGLLWGIMGAAGLVSALVVGRIRMVGRERWIMMVGLGISAVALLLLLVAKSVGFVAVAVFVLGLATGPFDVAIFTLRQRRTDQAWFGRVFAVSMSINTVGTPIGAALAGPLAAASVNTALVTSALTVFVAMFFPLLAIPAEEPAPRRR